MLGADRGPGSRAGRSLPAARRQRAWWTQGGSSAPVTAAPQRRLTLTRGGRRCFRGTRPEVLEFGDNVAGSKSHSPGGGREDVSSQARAAGHREPQGRRREPPPRRPRASPKPRRTRLLLAASSAEPRADARGRPRETLRADMTGSRRARRPRRDSETARGQPDGVGGCTPAPGRPPPQGAPRGPSKARPAAASPWTRGGCGTNTGYAHGWRRKAGCSGGWGLGCARAEGLPPPMCLSSASCPNWVPRPTAGCVRPPAVPESPRPPDARGHRLGGLAAPPAASQPRPSAREDTWWASTAAQLAPRTPPRADVHAQGLWRLPAPSAPSRTPRPLSHQHPTSWDQNP